MWWFYENSGRTTWGTFFRETKFSSTKETILEFWWTGFRDLYMDVSENSGFSPQIIHFNRVFHYFHPPFWGTPIFGNTHIKKACFGFLLWKKTPSSSKSFADLSLQEAVNLLDHGCPRLIMFLFANRIHVYLAYTVCWIVMYSVYCLQ